MNYSYWENEKKIKQILKEVRLDSDVESSGLPVIYENKKCYIDSNGGHSLVVGATGSGKTQAIVLPLVKLSLLAGESLIIDDIKGEIYNKTATEFKNRGYNVITLDFDNSVYGNSWNPLTLPYSLYLKGEKDRAINSIEFLGHYLFNEITSDSADPFWINSTIDYFTGICLYLFEYGKEKDITLNSVFSLANEVSKEDKCYNFLKKIGKNNTIYYNVSGTLEAPIDTRGGIISTFNQKLKKYISRENLSNMMATSDFDINNIAKEKTVIYIISGYSRIGDNLIPLFINQVFDTISISGNNSNYLNLVLDEFDRLLPIKDFVKVINHSRSLKIRFTVIIKSYMNLVNTYGKDNFELIKLCFSNIIYLLSNDLFTLSEISKLCGNYYDGKRELPLITPEELKTLNRFEAIFLLCRVMPFRTKLIPDYKIDWGFEDNELSFEKRKVNSLEIYSFDK